MALPPPKRVEMGALYRVLRPMELSADFGYTTKNLVRAKVIRQHVQTPFDRLKGNPAVALEELAGPDFQPRVVKPLVVEMPIHTVQPRRNPAATGLQETNADVGKALTHPAPDDAQGDEHHFHGVRDDVFGPPTVKAIDPDGGHATRPAFVEADAEIEFLGLGPEGVIVGMSGHAIIVRVGPQEAAPHAQFLA